MMAAIIGPNDKMAGIVGAAHGERATNWAQLHFHYQGLAFKLHHLALGEFPTSMNDVGPIYVRQALAMQKESLDITHI